MTRRADGVRPPRQAAAVQRDEGGVRHVALAPAHAGAPPAERTCHVHTCVLPFRSFVAAFAFSDAASATRRARRTRTAPSWRRCCSGTRPRWTGTWRRRARAWVTSRRRTTRARRRTCRLASRSCCSRCRSSRRREPRGAAARLCASVRRASARLVRFRRLTRRLRRRRARRAARRWGASCRATPTRRPRWHSSGTEAAPLRRTAAAAERAQRCTGERLRRRTRRAAQTRICANASKAIEHRRRRRPRVVVSY